RSDLPLPQVVLINSASGHLHVSASGGVTRKWPLVVGVKCKFNNHQVASESHLLNNVAIAPEAGNERTNKLLANGRISLHEAAGDLNGHPIRVVGHDTVLVRTAPRGVVLGHERSDIKGGSE